MSNVYFISDLHLGHKNILNFEPSLRFGNTTDEHDRILIERICSVANNKRDILYVLGDVAMEVSKLELLREIPARMILYRGNHDLFDDGVYRKYFDKIMGIGCYKGHWISHAPIHPFELRGRKNIHGHVHRNSIEGLPPNDCGFDLDYINVCVENTGGYPVNFNDIRDNTFEGRIKNVN